MSAVRPLYRPALVLGLFTLAATALLAVTDRLTREPIAAAERAALLRTLNRLIPAEEHENDLLGDTLTLPPDPRLGTRAPTTAYRARRGGRVETVAFTAVAPDGYNGDIVLLVAVHRDGRVAGVGVVSHRETPGLGDAIEASHGPWIRQFVGRALGDPPPARWKVKKDGGAFDQLTGATISPRAVVKAVRRALEWFADHRETLLAERPAPDRHAAEDGGITGHARGNGAMNLNP